MTVIACVLWVVSFEALPLLHVATHDQVGRHHHDATGAIVRDEYVFEPEPHDHDDHDHDDHDHDHEPSRGERSASERQHLVADALAHGRHSLAHHDVAIAAPPPVITSPLPCDRRSTFVVVATAIDPVSFSPGRAVARGPPVAPFVPQT